MLAVIDAICKWKYAAYSENNEIPFSSNKNFVSILLFGEFQLKELIEFLNRVFYLGGTKVSFLNCKYLKSYEKIILKNTVFSSKYIY